MVALAHANPLRNDAGEIVGAVNVLVNITERSLAEKELKETDKRKDEFLAVLAHELRNPLSPISSAVEILHLIGASSDEGQWALSVIDRQMHHMTRLIDDLLDVARIRGNKLDLRRERMDMHEALQAAVETSAPLFKEANHDFITSLPAQPLYLNGDLVRLAQVISNLLSNAAKYTPRGGRIWLSAVQQDTEVIITIRDSGIGISSNMLPLIFEMFTQGHHSHGTSGGLGIGLMLVKRLLDMHDGSITIESEGAGKGTTCTVRLPLLMESVVRLVSVDEPTHATQGLRILIVDDNLDAAATMDTMLTLQGNETMVAHDGLEAIEKAAKYRPDVILLDIGMPKMNGYEAAKAIRLLDWGKEVTLIALTGWGQMSDKELSSEAGFDYHLTKPADVGVLTKLLYSLEGQKKYSHI